MQPKRTVGFFTRQLRRVLGLTATSPVRTSVSRHNANRFRPALEALDARVVPSIWTDATGDGQFSNPGNWDTNTVPGAFDAIEFTAPNPSQGFPGSTDSVQGMTGTFLEIDINSSYTGTITFSGPVNVTFQYTQAGGTIVQPSSTSDLGFTGDGTGIFDWTGGTIGTTDSGATIHLAGAIATIGAGAGNTITTSDTISLESRTDSTGDPIVTTAFFNPGTLNFNGGLGLSVDNLCSADVNAPQNATVTFTAGLTTFGNQTVTVKAGGTLTVGGPGAWNDGIELTNNGGTVEITGNAVATFSPPQGVGEYTVKQTLGTIKLHSGATLAAKSFGLDLEGGALRIIGDSPNGATAPAMLDGSMFMKGAAIFFEGNFWTFNVTGSVKWVSGSFNPRVDTSTNGSSDIWLISGQLTIPNDSAAQIIPVTLNWNQATGIPGTWRWKPLIFGSVQLPDNGALPTIVTPPGSAPMQLFPTVDPQGNTVWLLGPKAN